MVYGSAIFMGVPWETIIKIYRNNLGKKPFNTLKEYANDFVEFLDNGNLLFPNSVQEEYLRNSIYSYFDFIKDTITKRVHSVIEEKVKVTDEEIEQIVSKIIREHYENWEKADNIPSIPKSYNKNIINEHKNIIEKAIEEVFEELPISKSHSNQLKKIAASLFSKFPEDIEKGDISGVVT
jgi:predicted Zn-dependent peptidase